MNLIYPRIENLEEAIFMFGEEKIVMLVNNAISNAMRDYPLFGPVIEMYIRRMRQKEEKDGQKIQSNTG